MDYKEKVKGLPNSPGVYIMKGPGNETLYVGKAADIRKRVSSYFYPNRRLPERLDALVRSVEDITYIPTSTEAEALIYENSLIKQLTPKYNVALRDDKSYPMLKLTADERYPRLFITRKKRPDGAIYYGPYSDVKLLRESLVILRQMFPLRSCGRLGKKACLNYHIKQCVAPCIGNIDEVAYGRIVSELKLFLEGRRSELLKVLSQEMAEAARREDFEGANLLKRRIEALSAIKEKRVSYRPLDEIEELKNILKVRGPLDVIEAFDVSNIMGKSAVGSMISFYRGRPKKEWYRRFRIKTVSGIDDYAMMRELVKRRYARLVGEKKRLPDLILIDGGKGHLAVALDELQKIGISDIPAIGIAKEFEHIYSKEDAGPIVLPKESKALHLLERIRDEAHRFAISYHKRLVSKNIRLSELDGIPGVGERRKKALLGYFGSVEKIKKAGIKDLMKAEGMNERSAQNIVGYFKER